MNELLDHRDAVANDIRETENCGEGSRRAARTMALPNCVLQPLVCPFHTGEFHLQLSAGEARSRQIRVADLP